ncbi:MAG: ASCH domain-containing protein [Gammaproteobacteria bacterium]
MIGENTPETESFWLKCRDQHQIEAEDYHVGTFADPRYAEYHDELLGLMLEGKKYATAHMARDFEKNNIPRRQVGDYWVVVDTQNNLVGLVKVIEVAVTSFNEVTAEFAAREGEGDSSLEYWQNVHKEYFLLQLADWGEDWSEDCPVVCETFSLVATPEK